jgi:hypothetical protein
MYLQNVMLKLVIDIETRHENNTYLQLSHSTVLDALHAFSPWKPTNHTCSHVNVLGKQSSASRKGDNLRTVRNDKSTGAAANGILRYAAIRLTGKQYKIMFNQHGEFRARIDLTRCDGLGAIATRSVPAWRCAWQCLPLDHPPLPAILSLLVSGLLASSLPLAATRCHPLPLAVHPLPLSTLCHALSLFVTLCYFCGSVSLSATLCHSLSLFATLCHSANPGSCPLCGTLCTLCHCLALSPPFTTLCLLVVMRGNRCRAQSLPYQLNSRSLSACTDSESAHKQRTKRVRSNPASWCNYHANLCNAAVLYMRLVHPTANRH